LGSEIFTNTGHAGEVTLYGGVGTSTTMTTSASTTTTTTLPANYRILLIGTGANITHRNQWAGWFNNGSTVTEGRGKRAAYDGMPVTSLRFSDSSGAWAEYDLTAPYSGRSLLTIVQDCMGADRFNDGGWKWQHGHCSVGILKSSRDIASAATQLRIGVGDGSVDNTLDWGQCRWRLPRHTRLCVGFGENHQHGACRRGHAAWRFWDEHLHNDQQHNQCEQNKNGQH